jgi:hypothetical protein
MRSLADHPRTVNLRDDASLEALNAWSLRVGRGTLASQDLAGEGAGRHETAKQRLTDAKARLRQHQAAKPA